MAFNFATGTDDGATTPTTTPKVPTTSGGNFDFATGTTKGQPAPVAEPQPSQFQQYFPGTLKSLADIQSDPFSLHGIKEQMKTNDPNQVWKDVGSAFSDAWKNAEAQQGKKGFGGFLSQAAAGAGILFSPISALFKAADDVPILGTASKLIQLPFTFAGEFGKDYGQGIIDKLPIKNPETKQQLKEGVGDIFALAAQLAIGKAGDVVLEGMKSKYSPEDVKTMTEVAQKMVAEHQSPEGAVARATTAVHNPELQPEIPKTGEQSVVENARKAVEEPTTEGVVTKAASDINKTLVEKGFDSLPDSELAKYSPIKKAQVINDITDLMNSNIEDAKQMALGKKEIPDNIKEQPLFNAISRLAKDNNDGELLNNLSKSPIGTERSVAAQTLGSAGFNSDPLDPVNMIQDINKSAEKKAKSYTGKDVVKEQKKIIEKYRKTPKVKIPKQSLSEFIKSIEC